MTTFEAYWDKIFFINRDARRDRWEHVMQQCARWGLTTLQRFEAHEGTQRDGSFNGNFGCTASHRALLEVIAYHGWERVLVLEDDFEIVNPGHDGDHYKGRLPFHAQWAQILPEIPTAWDMLYLGGQYRIESPITRVSPHIIKLGQMLTTSSYGITAKFARKMAPHISGVGPIDVLYSSWHEANRCYCVQPRLFVQYENHSDLMDQRMKNHWSMLDANHEKTA